MVGKKEAIYPLIEEVWKMREQMKAGARITEELKAVEQMKWVGFMNSVRSATEEIADEISYTCA